MREFSEACEAQMATALISLGSNLGNRSQMLAEALGQLDQHEQIVVQRQSRLLETTPVGGPAGQGEFLNAAARVETTLSPSSLLAVSQDIEASLGRRRQARWGARVIDLDLILYDDQVVSLPHLTIPHPRMVFRRFVLTPAAEVAPEMRHPQLGWTVAQLLDHLDSTPPLVAVTGSASARRQVASAAAERLNCRYVAGRGDEHTVWPGPLLFDEAGSHNFAIRSLSDTRLVIIVDPPNDDSLAAQAVWERLVTRKSVPWLDLRGVTWEDAVEETVAAVVAMR